jgi:hypothetical protein
MCTGGQNFNHRCVKKGKNANSVIKKEAALKAAQATVLAERPSERKAPRG